MTPKQGPGSCDSPSVESAEQTPTSNGGEAPVLDQKAKGGLIIRSFADLPSNAILDEEAMASVFSVTPRTVRNMVRRNQIPPAIPLRGKSVWVAGLVLAHILRAAERAAQNADKQAAAIETAGKSFPHWTK